MNKNDLKIKELQQAIEIRKKTIGPRPKGNLKTNGILRIIPDKVININTLNTDEALVEILYQIRASEHFWNIAAKELGVSVPFQFNEFPVEDIAEDLKLRANIIAWDKQKKLLDTQEQLLKRLLSEEAQIEDTLSEIASSLK